MEIVSIFESKFHAMNKFLFVLFCLVSTSGFAQKDTNKWVRVFPITDYITTASESIKIVQVQLPKDLRIADNQMSVGQRDA